MDGGHGVWKNERSRWLGFAIAASFSTFQAPAGHPARCVVRPIKRQNPVCAETCNMKVSTETKPRGLSGCRTRKPRRRQPVPPHRLPTPLGSDGRIPTRPFTVKPSGPATVTAPASAVIVRPAPEPSALYASRPPASKRWSLYRWKAPDREKAPSMKWPGGSKLGPVAGCCPRVSEWPAK